MNLLLTRLVLHTSIYTLHIILHTFQIAFLCIIFLDIANNCIVEKKNIKTMIVISFLCIINTFLKKKSCIRPNLESHHFKAEQL